MVASNEQNKPDKPGKDDIAFGGKVVKRGDAPMEGNREIAYGLLQLALESILPQLRELDVQLVAFLIEDDGTLAYSQSYYSEKELADIIKSWVKAVREDPEAS